MKNKIMLSLIIILTIISGVSIGIVVYQSKNYVKIPDQFKCQTEKIETNGVGYQQIVILNIDNEQYVESYQNKSLSTYTDQTQYEFAKQVQNTETVTYSFDDNSKSVLSDFGTEELKDADNNKVNIWYRDYIKNLELSGYTCKLLK